MNVARTSLESPGAVILVGNPNVGKSVVFGALTGRYVNVSNYPGTTVEITRGEARDRGTTIEVIDTPGVYSLLPMSEDERVTRDILMRESGARVLQVCDAKNMRRSLMITVQLAEMEIPLVLAVNMTDEARERGVMPRLETLEERLGVPAVSTVAVRKKGTDRLLPLLEHANPSSVRIDYGSGIETAILRMEKVLPARTPIGKRALAIMLLCGDDSLAPWLSEDVSSVRIREMNDVRNRLIEETGEEIVSRVHRARLSWIDRLLVELGVEDSAPSSRNVHAGVRPIRHGPGVRNSHPSWSSCPSPTASSAYSAQDTSSTSSRSRSSKAGSSPPLRRSSTAFSPRRSCGTSWWGRTG